jgi:putative transposase
MVRGIERTPIFCDDPDRTDFVARLAALADARVLTVYAWALLRIMQPLGPDGVSAAPAQYAVPPDRFAGAFNRRHKRIGHLFQNRY